MTPAEGLTAAAAQYRQGDRAACLEICVGLLTSEVAATAAELAILCAAELGRGDFVPAILAILDQRGLPAAVIARRACHNMLKLRRAEALGMLAAEAPPGQALSILALYYAACALLVDGAREAALGLFEQFRHRVRDYFAIVPFTHDDNFNVLFRQGTLVRPAAGVAQLVAAASRPMPELAAITIERRAADAPAVFFACADGRYIARFAAGFTAALDRTGISAHLHVVNPTPEADALLAGLPDRLQHLSLGVSRSVDRQYHSATAYACARFYVLPALLDLYARPVVALDIDIVPLAPIFALAESGDLSSLDFACFETERDEPASIYQASVMVWNPNAAGRRFLEVLQIFCSARLDLPVRLNWQLDQAALLSVLNWQSETGQAFRFARLNDLLSCRFDEAVAPAAEESEKLAIKEAATGIDPRYVDADGMVQYPWEP